MIDQASYGPPNNASPTQNTIFINATNTKPMPNYWFVMSVMQQNKIVCLFKFQRLDQ